MSTAVTAARDPPTPANAQHASNALRTGREAEGAGVAHRRRRARSGTVDHGNCGRADPSVSASAQASGKADRPASRNHDVVALGVSLMPSPARRSCGSDPDGSDSLAGRRIRRAAMPAKTTQPRRRPQRPGESAAPYWTWSRWRRTCFAAAARSTAGSACSADRCWARRWWRRCGRSAGAHRPLAARLFPAAGRPGAADRLRGRAGARRRQLHHPPRHGHPAWPGHVRR